MNTDTTFGTAVLRAAYTAAILGLLAFITTYQQTDDLKTSALAGTSAALGILALRGGVEGFIDQHRQATNDQKPSDVGYDRLAVKRD